MSGSYSGYLDAWVLQFLPLSLPLPALPSSRGAFGISAEMCGTASDLTTCKILQRPRTDSTVCRDILGFVKPGWSTGNVN